MSAMSDPVVPARFVPENRFDGSPWRSETEGQTHPLSTSAGELIQGEYTGVEAMPLRLGFAILAIAATSRLGEAECHVYRDAVAGRITSRSQHSDGLHLSFVAVGTATPSGSFSAQGEWIINGRRFAGTGLLTDRSKSSIRLKIVGGALVPVFGGLSKVSLTTEFDGGTGIYRGVTGGYDGRYLLMGQLFVGRSLGEICFDSDDANGG